MESLKGRLWDGKHSLLQSMKAVCVLCKNSIMTLDNPQPVQVLKYLYLLVGCARNVHVHVYVSQN